MCWNLCISMFAGACNMRICQNIYWKTWKSSFIKLMKCERGFCFVFLYETLVMKMASTSHPWKIIRFTTVFDLKWNVSAESLLRCFLVKGRAGGQPVFSHNKGARCPSVKAAWVTWRMWLAYRDLSASWTGSDIRRCHRAVDANFSCITFLYVLGTNGDNVAGPFHRSHMQRLRNYIRKRAFLCFRIGNQCLASHNTLGICSGIIGIHNADGALFQILWLSLAFFEETEQEIAPQIILLSWSSSQQNKNYSSSAGEFLNIGSGGG